MDTQPRSTPGARIAASDPDPSSSALGWLLPLCLWCLQVRKNSEAATDEERYRLETVGEFHLGEFVNKFVRG